MLKYQDIQHLFQQQLSHLYDKEEINALLKEAISDVKTNFHLLELTPVQVEKLQHILTELTTGKPIQQILGKAYFYNLDFIVNGHVLIPRPETEELVHLIVQNHQGEPLNLLDIGTGSGCIPISLKKNLPLASISSMDISEDALAVAKKNAEIHDAPVIFFQDDALRLNGSKYPKYDVIVSNPPYIKLNEKPQMHLNVLDFEPHLALFVEDENPLIFYGKIADFALTNLQETGTLYFEINQNLAQETQELLISKGFKAEVFKDINQNNRFIKAYFNLTT